MSVVTGWFFLFSQSLSASSPPRHCVFEPWRPERWAGSGSELAKDYSRGGKLQPRQALVLKSNSTGIAATTLCLGLPRAGSAQQRSACTAWSSHYPALYRKV